MNATYEQILENERKAQAEYEAKTVVDGFTIAELRKVMDAVQNKDHWKKPWAASVPSQIVRAVFVAVEFFHADKPTLHGIEPLTGHVLMSGRGYQA